MSLNFNIVHLGKLSKVSLLKVAAYCSPNCQQEGWRIHEKRLVLRMLLFFVFHLSMREFVLTQRNVSVVGWSAKHRLVQAS